MIMLSGAGFISFINFFMVPLLGLRIYNKRHHLKWEASLEFLYGYARMCVFTMVLGRLYGGISRIFLERVVDWGTLKYTLVVLVISLVLPYFMELVEKGVHVEVEIGTVEENGEQADA